MVVNISQCASVFDETYNVLKFASVAKQVRRRVTDHFIMTLILDYQLVSNTSVLFLIKELCSFNFLQRYILA